MYLQQRHSSGTAHSSAGEHNSSWHTLIHEHPYRQRGRAPLPSERSSTPTVREVEHPYRQRGRSVRQSVWGVMICTATVINSPPAVGTKQ